MWWCRLDPWSEWVDSGCLSLTAECIVLGLVVLEVVVGRRVGNHGRGRVHTRTGVVAWKSWCGGKGTDWNGRKGVLSLSLSLSE